MAALDHGSRLDWATGAVAVFPVPDGLLPRQITVAPNGGDPWYTMLSGREIATLQRR